jgi:hypothetical protein
MTDTVASSSVPLSSPAAARSGLGAARSRTRRGVSGPSPNRLATQLATVLAPRCPGVSPCAAGTPAAVTIRPCLFRRVSRVLPLLKVAKGAPQLQVWLDLACWRARSWLQGLHLVLNGLENLSGEVAARGPILAGREIAPGLHGRPGAPVMRRPRPMWREGAEQGTPG